MTLAPEAYEQQRPADGSRARYPDEEGYIERDGVRVFWEFYGSGEPTILFLPDLDARALARLEGADPVLRASLPRRLLRPARQRPLGPPAGPGGATTSASSPRTRST